MDVQRNHAAQLPVGKSHRQLVLDWQPDLFAADEAYSSKVILLVLCQEVDLASLVRIPFGCQVALMETWTLLLFRSSYWR